MLRTWVLELEGCESRVYEGAGRAGLGMEQSEINRGGRSRAKRDLVEIPKDKELESKMATVGPPKTWEPSGVEQLPHQDIRYQLAQSCETQMLILLLRILSVGLLSHTIKTILLI